MVGKKLVKMGLVGIVLAMMLFVLTALAGCSGGSSVEVKGSLDDYSWEELSQISAEIAKASDEKEAIEIAGKYNLVGPDGTLDGTQTKLVAMAGSQVPVHIIGFAHDDKTGGGKAGITFQFVDCIAEHEMNPLSSDEAVLSDYAAYKDLTIEEAKTRKPDGVSTNSGGWEASAMREWLNSYVVPRLPEDLAAVIVSVDKKTNNIGQTEDTSSVTITSDTLWLPSFVELSGGIDFADFGISDDVDLNSLPPEYSNYIAILDAEGSEYKLFRDMNVRTDAGNSILVKHYDGSSCNWWERSAVSLSPCDFMGVIDGGSEGSAPSSNGEADGSQGVAPCFCI